MDWRELDNQIDLLAQSIPSVGGMAIFLQRHDWKPIWDRCKSIQEGFRGTRYPNREAHQAAWERFNSLRDTASRNRDLEREQWRERSDGLRRDILDLTRRARWSRVLDAVFFFDKTTVAEMKQLGGLLGQARRELSTQKERMIGEHKKECFEAIVEAQATHDEFWGRYKAELDRRQTEYEGRQAEHRERQVAWEARQRERTSRIQQNIERNRENLSKAVSALYRQKERASELREKLRETSSPKWAAIFSEWLVEAESKIEDIEASVRRITGWIEEGEEQLRR